MITVHKKVCKSNYYPTIKKQKHGFSLLSIDSGLSYITYYMVKSFRENISNDIPIIIISDKTDEYSFYLDKILEDFNNIQIYIKDIYQTLSWSAQHSFYLQYGIDNYINTENLIICDNDVIFLKPTEFYDFRKMLDNFMSDNYYKIYGYMFYMSHYILYYLNGIPMSKEYLVFNNYKIDHIEYNKYICKYKNYNCTYYDRIDPYICLLKTEIFKNNDIKIFNPKNKELDFIFNKELYIDTFGKFTYDVLKHNIPINTQCEINKFVYHLCGSSGSNIKSIINYEKAAQHFMNSDPWNSKYFE